jgi:formylglycine-generating enzyme required for sulfatase activity
MHGNVWQWVEDCYKNSYSGAPTDGSAVTSKNCSVRVFRGGSWSNSPRYLRSARRYGDSADDRGFRIGFRVGRMLSVRADAITVSPGEHLSLPGRP